MKNIIVWYRNDLRIHDHPALSLAVRSADHVIPVFIFDETIYNGKHGSSNRNRFLVESLEDLKASLKKIGGDLVIRNGDAKQVLTTLAKEFDASAIYYTADYTPYAIKRDRQIQDTFAGTETEVRALPGRLIVSTLDKIKTKNGTAHKVFTPFWKTWMNVGRRQLATDPSAISLPSGIKVGSILPLSSLTIKDELSPNVAKGGETEALRRLESFFENDIDSYHKNNNDMGLPSTSRLSPYLHFGCLSPLYAESQLPDNEGARSWQRQLAWRDFYHYVLFYNPNNSKQEYQEKYRLLEWNDSSQHLRAWQEGKTGYPAVDAAMRQLNKEGWMHNRARLIVGSFLTKDLGLDWRLGEAYFMKRLIDGDQANNNGNWQWIAGVGVDPAPIYRRLYNPSLQRDRYDPSGAFVRTYIPELKNVPDKYLSEPWQMPEDIQKGSKCIIGDDYPNPIIDHKLARKEALERYRSVDTDPKAY